MRAPHTIARSCALAAMLLLGSGPLLAAQQRSDDPAREARLAWFRDAKYGLFIHWGLYAIPAGEWKGKRVLGLGEWIMNRARIPAQEYARLAAQFNPVKFDADAWVKLAQELVKSPDAKDRQLAGAIARYVQQMPAAIEHMRKRQSEKRRELPGMQLPSRAGPERARTRPGIERVRTGPEIER